MFGLETRGGWSDVVLAKVSCTFVFLSNEQQGWLLDDQCQQVGLASCALEVRGADGVEDKSVGAHNGEAHHRHTRTYPHWKPLIKSSKGIEDAHVGACEFSPIWTDVGSQRGVHFCMNWTEPHNSLWLDWLLGCTVYDHNNSVLEQKLNIFQYPPVPHKIEINVNGAEFTRWHTSLNKNIPGELF